MGALAWCQARRRGSTNYPCAHPYESHRNVAQILDDQDECCDEDGLDAIVHAAASPTERTQLQATVELVEKRHKAAVGYAKRSLMCCDGTPSESCSSQGDHQGYCSHHGGVCGCQ